MSDFGMPPILEPGQFGPAFGPLAAPLGPTLDQAPSPYDMPDEQMRARFMNQVRADLARAKGAKSKLNTRAKRWRKTLNLDEKAAPYEGAPAITMPLTRLKRDGVIAHLHDALDVEPFFAGIPYTADATEIVPVYESLMERELIAGDGRSQYLMGLREAVDVGTGVIGWSLAFNAAGEVVIQEQLTRFENFYAYPVAVDDLTNCATFRRYKEPWFVLKRMADMGILNPEVVDRLREAGGGSEEMTAEEVRDASADGQFSPEHETQEIWEAYCRWRGDLWHVRFSEKAPEALSIKLSPFREAFDAPPYELLRIMRSPGYLWGFSIPGLLESIQKIMDWAENSRLAYNQFAISPILMADRMNPFFKKVQSGGLTPGMVLETMGPPNLSGIEVLQLPKPDLTLEEMNLAQRFADMATFNDFQVAGAPFAQGRRTATEVRTSFDIGTLKLRRMLGDVRDDLGRAAKKRWALIELFRVRPHGVTTVYREDTQFLISSDGVTRQELEQAYLEFAQMTGLAQADPQVVMQELAPGNLIGDYSLLAGGIPGMKRDDIRWTPNGGDIIPDKHAELAKMDAFAPYMNWLGAAQQDDRIWQFLKTRLLLMGRHDWKKYIGESPKRMMDSQQYAALMQQLTAQSAQLANTGAQGAA